MLVPIINLIKEMRERKMLVSAIISSTASIPGWVHFIEYQGEYYITFNTHDIERALREIGTSVKMAHKTVPAIFDVPYYHDDEDMCVKVMKGVFENSISIMAWAGKKGSQIVH